MIDNLVAIIVDNFWKKVRVSNARPFKIVRTRDEVDMQWARSAVSAGLPMSFFDNKEVRKAVHMTTECGENYIRTKPGGVKDTTVTHRTYFTTKLIPKLDKFIDDKNILPKRSSGLLARKVPTTCTVI